MTMPFRGVIIRTQVRKGHTEFKVKEGGCSEPEIVWARNESGYDLQIGDNVRVEYHHGRWRSTPFINRFVSRPVSHRVPRADEINWMYGIPFVIQDRDARVSETGLTGLSYPDAEQIAEAFKRLSLALQYGTSDRASHSARPSVFTARGSNPSHNTVRVHGAGAVVLKDIKPGTLFRLDGGDTIYIRTHLNEFGTANCKIGAVSLRSGALCKVDDCKRVVPVPAGSTVEIKAGGNR